MCKEPLEILDFEIFLKGKLQPDVLSYYEPLIAKIQDSFLIITSFYSFDVVVISPDEKIRILKIIGARYTTTMRPPPPAHQKPPGCSTKLCF